jgi:hypothetical protein
MQRRRFLLAAALFAGCASEADRGVPPEPPKAISADFGRLSLILDEIRESRDVVLFEGLPSEFWEPQLLEQELKRKKTIRLHGYPFYEEPVALQGSEAERFTALLSDKSSFKRHRGPNRCGGYQPDFCVEWKNRDVPTRALICMECGEVKVFGPRSEVHCDLDLKAEQRLEEWLRPYRKNRPAAEAKG